MPLWAIPTGDGQVDVGGMVIWDHQLSSDWKVMTNAGLEVQLPDSLDRRIPTTAGDPLSNDIESVSRNLGDKITLGTGLVFGNPRKGFSIGAGYTFQHMAATSFSGTRFNSTRYGLLEGLQANQAQTMHSATLQASFATIEWFKEGKFFYPFQVHMTYSKPFAGRNVAAADLIAAEIVLFF